MRRISLGRWAALALLLVSPTLWATPVYVGGKLIEIPAPAGFELMVPSMTPAYELLAQVNPPGNQTLATFITHEDAQLARAHKIPGFRRTLSVQVSKATTLMTCTPEMLGQVKTIVRDHNNEIIAKVAPDMAQFNTQTSQAITQMLRTKVDLKVGAMVPLPMHEETERSMAYSMYTHTAFALPAAPEVNNPDLVNVATVNFVLAQERIVFVYAYGEEDDLEWTRHLSHDWVAKIVAANAP